MNKPKTHDNTATMAFLSGYFHAKDLCEQFPKVDSIFSGVLELKTAGNTSTRALSRQVLFRILQWCPRIDIESINEVTNRQYAYSSLAIYASVARVASKAIAQLIGGLPEMTNKTTVRQSQQELDAPYFAELKDKRLM